MSTTAPPTGSRSFTDVGVHLHAIADMVGSLPAGGDLAAPVEIHVTLSAGYDGTGNDASKMAMVDQVAAAFGVKAAFADKAGRYGAYRAKLHGDGRPWELCTSAYVMRPDPNAALRAELEQLRAKVAAFESAADERVTYKLGSSYSGPITAADVARANALLDEARAAEPPALGSSYSGAVLDAIAGTVAGQVDWSAYASCGGCAAKAGQPCNYPGYPQQLLDVAHADRLQLDAEEYAQAELDQDRNPTAEGFAAWQARRADAHQALQDGQR